MTQQQAVSPASVPPAVHRRDYRKPHYLVDHVHLEFDLSDLNRVEVACRAVYTRDGDAGPEAPLVLNARDLELLAVRIDGRALGEHEIELDDRQLVLKRLPGTFELEIRNSLVAAGNMSLMGLCESRDGGLYTQCEPEAFRSLTYFQDRPDLLCKFTTRLVAVKADHPVLLAGGNLVDEGDLPGGRHFAVWHNPVPTPCYLFAICAGKLESVTGSYTFGSGRRMEIEIYATGENIGKVAHSMELLKRAIQWDEEVYGREYDLDTFKCGVLNGSTGGMENKGLNLFDLYWFATDPRIAFDPDYEYRMKSIAHEYFHNWSGNIVTVRNWFQVSLKEGLTRFRDQRFLGDMSEHDAVRIRMVRHIRANQWTEDAGPLVHPVICEKYIDPRNTFTITTYDKGQEIVYMLRTLLGEERFLAGVRRFFDDNAYAAVTIDEFLQAFDDGGGEGIPEMAKWYYQAGTPTVTVRTGYDEENRIFELSLSQRTEPTPGQPDKEPVPIPVAVALLDGSGNEMDLQLEGSNEPQGTNLVLRFDDEHATYRFTGVEEKPVPSLFRHFSAPVPVEHDLSSTDLYHLLRHDADGVTRWDIGETLASDVILCMVDDLLAGREPQPASDFLEAYSEALFDERASPRLIADLVTLPDEKSLGQHFEIIPIEEIHTAREIVRLCLADRNRDRLVDLYHRCRVEDPLDMSSGAIGTRRLKSVCLDYLVALGEDDCDELAFRQVRDDGNTSNQVYALMSLANSDSACRDEALALFRDRWRNEQLVYDKWFLAQALAARTDSAERLAAVTATEEFSLQMLSRVFATTEAFFCLNRYGFNERSGSGYRLMAELLPRMDRHSSLVAIFMLARSDINNWRAFDAGRQEKIKACLNEICNAAGASDGLVELARKTLADRAR